MPPPATMSLQQTILSMESQLRRTPVLLQSRITLPLRAVMMCPPPSPVALDQRPLTSKWDLQFLDSLANEEVLFEVMMAAHYLNIPRLEHLTCVRTVRMRGMTPEQAHAVFNLASDFTPEEEAAIRRQIEWAFSRT
ncbi:hypothetical protein L7F22_016977 [Adiantum nelumboides]|nr:hypothetical protein [Adiantum nelumboides]